MSVQPYYDNRTVQLFCESVRIVQLRNESDVIISWPDVCVAMQGHGITLQEDDCIKMWFNLANGLMEKVDMFPFRFQNDNTDIGSFRETQQFKETSVGVYLSCNCVVMYHISVPRHHMLCATISRVLPRVSAAAASRDQPLSTARHAENVSNKQESSSILVDRQKRPLEAYHSQLQHPNKAVAVGQAMLPVRRPATSVQSQPILTREPVIPAAVGAQSASTDTSIAQRTAVDSQRPQAMSLALLAEESEQKYLMAAMFIKKQLSGHDTWTCQLCKKVFDTEQQVTAHFVSCPLKRAREMQTQALPATEVRKEIGWSDQSVSCIYSRYYPAKSPLAPKTATVNAHPHVTSTQISQQQQQQRQQPPAFQGAQTGPTVAAATRVSATTHSNAESVTLQSVPTLTTSISSHLLGRIQHLTANKHSTQSPELYGRAEANDPAIPVAGSAVSSFPVATIPVIQQRHISNAPYHNQSISVPGMQSCSVVESVVHPNIPSEEPS